MSMHNATDSVLSATRSATSTSRAWLEAHTSVAVVAVQTLGVAAVGAALLRRRVGAGATVAVLVVSSSYWTSPGARPWHEFASILAGCGVLCAAVLLSVGPHRRWGSLKLLAGTATQASVSEYSVFPRAWASQLVYWPTDAMLLSLLFTLPSALALLCFPPPALRMWVTSVVHLLLAAATLGLRFHHYIDTALDTVLVGKLAYAALTYTALLLAVSNSPAYTPVCAKRLPSPQQDPGRDQGRDSGETVKKVTIGA